VSYIEIERAANKCKINIHTARPGIVIGKRGAGVETLKKEVQALTENEVFLNIVEVRKAETNAQLVAENIATQLERRIAFRRAMKKAVQTAMKFGAKGIKVASAGRSAAPRCRAVSGTARAACRCTPCAPTSSTASPRPTPRTARSA
jgi:small subunit ribosomal protein S3